MSEERLEFALELVTPAFIAGARAKDADTSLRHQRRRPLHRLIGPDGDGLRIPSLRGLLRFWFRAKEGLAPGALSAYEGRIFGSTERGQGLRLIPRESSKWEPAPIEAAAGSARSYLGYGPLNYVAAGQASSHNKFAFRDAIPAGTRFSFLAIGSDAQIGELRKCLALIELFGAIGGRSRRGWGSLHVECKDLSGIPRDQAGPWVEEVLSRHVWPAAGGRPSALGASPVYSAFWSGSRIRCLRSVYPSPEDVFDVFFEQFRLTRLYNRKVPAKSPPIALADHAAELATMTGGAIASAPQRMAFGFPYNVRFSAGGEVEYTASDAATTPPAEIHRRASPLVLKVIKLGPNRFGGVALFFNNPFFGSGTTTIGAKVNGTVVPGSVPPPPTTAVDAFLSQPAWLPVAVP